MPQSTGSTSARHDHIEQIVTVFSDVPTLHEVAVTQVQALLDTHYPALNYLARRVAIGTPLRADQHHYSPLPDEVLLRLASAAPVRYVEGHHQAAVHQRENYVPGGPSLADMERWVNQLGPRLLEAWLARLGDWWRDTVPVQTTRWAYLSASLLALLYDCDPPAGMDEQAFERIFPRERLRPIRPDAQWSVQQEALSVCTVQVRRQGSTQAPRMLPVLVLDHAPSGAQARTLLLFSPATGIHPLDSLDAIEALIPDYLSQDLGGGAVEWFIEQPPADPFDLLAACYAERQRLDVLAIDPTVPRTPRQYQQMLDYVTDPRRWFETVLTPVQQRLQDALPLWLVHASADDSLAYARGLQALAEQQARAAGQGFLDGIPPIRAFAAEALKRCLAKQPLAKDLNPDDIELTFNLVTAAMLPGGYPSGDVQRVSLSLTELALENLRGFPHAPSQITLKGRAAPTWLSASLLLACVTEVDIGQSYPDLLKQKLISDPPERARREALFTGQLRAQLPLLALQMKLKGEGGLTQTGARLVATAVASAADEQAAIWPLAFKASPTAAEDPVLSHFVIGPRNSEQGPHLLYRPLFTPSLREFESPRALLQAIQAPGELQDNVLAWIAPSRQAVYANGGFLEPHIRHFHQGDEFSVPARPAPAQLSKQVQSGDPLPRLFAATAEALVSLADAESVSNAEQRWATIKAGGWLLFSSALPFLRGPALLAGWMVQVLDSVQRDVVASTPADPVAQTEGAMDLLSNLVMVLAYRASPHERPATLDLRHPVFARTRATLASPSPTVTRSAAALPTHAPYRWSSARDTLTPFMRERLEGLSLRAVQQPWPLALPGAETSGRLKGLLQDTRSTPPQWQAVVRGHVYRVRLVGDSVQVTDTAGTASGPWLKPLEGGGWDLDLRLRLRGGQADTPAAPASTEARRQQLEQDLRQYAQRRETAERAIGVARSLKTSHAGHITEQQRIAADARYLHELQNKLEASRLELQCLKDLQALRPRPGYERELSTLLEGQILNLRQLLQYAREATAALHARLVPALELVQAESAAEAMSDINQEAHRSIIEGMRLLADQNQNAIVWRSLEIDTLDALERVPKYGRDKAQAFKQSEAATPTVLELQSLQVSALWAVALNSEGPKLDDDFFQSLDDTVQRARWASGSQAQLDELASHNPELRVELLESFDRVYAQTDDRIEFWRAMEPDKFHLGYLEKLQQLFAQLHLQVQRELAATLEPAPVTRPASRVRQKKIIRTRNQDLYVARVTVTSDEQPIEIAEVTDAQNEVIASFTQATDGIWEPLNKTPVQRTTSLPNLARLIEQGQALRAPVEKAIAEVLKMARNANEPQSLQDILEQRADKLRRCADAIQQRLLLSEPDRLAATQRARARTETDELRAAASRLSEQGLQARLTAIKARPPTQAGLDVLVGHREAKVYRQGERVALAGRSDDWLQSYVVIDEQSRQPWCYGHFHYGRQTGPDDHFSAAHLKTPEQHRLGKQAQIQVQAQAFASMQAGQSGRVSQTLEIHRGEINLRMARKLFFDAPAWPEGKAAS
ncbi:MULTISPECIES: hypothetical protein [Pseudomonas]|uniref:Uncharacterized protein n=1 Tax=Pseudomonas rhodesiae TaxID=76760 RepID=A0A8I1E736_9PSED|nr:MULTISPECIES: hypothetical protein [Pseudomonas]MBI6602646.1 hypothetical protein [Pseudomonas sp. S4_EA_1b]MBI6626068.1 hypothetical protein [Pseudomonas rhodesiae]NMY78563.1 hypothetical protein [Pseudomonas rhodesiae]